MANRLFPPVLTRRRMWLACAVAMVADGIQLVLGPMGWLGADEAIDVVTMCVLTGTLGFHPLLLPTFVVEVLPVIDMFPTWTACTFAVIALRRKKSAPPPQSSGPIIDV